MDYKIIIKFSLVSNWKLKTCLLFSVTVEIEELYDWDHDRFQPNMEFTLI